MISLRGLLLRFFLVMVLMEVSGARTIQWFSDAQNVNVDSGGAPMDGGYRFELGVFAAGFTPTTANTAQWAANWSAAQRLIYNPVTQRFTGQYTVTSNVAPFTVGANAWVWGFGGRAGNEWLLFRAPSWTWPAPDSTNPSALSWNAKNATQVVAGSIQSSGSPSLMRTVAVTNGAAPSTTYARWRDEELNGVVLGGAEDDADGDGIPNVMEFVFGTRPMTPDTLPPVTTSLGAGGVIQLSIPRRLDRLANLSIQSSPNLQTWGSASAEATLVSNGSAAWVVSFPISSSGRRFFRVVATP
ncbi:hypothetical protein OKA04_12515 [Luteolibacter flavescens]|uniref:Uncharacterized protein n=1 Tax=Luteolibacter flavescens TaxID=1859460 RepID=A0ABT3FQG5_9BACT|nr:hypothetical protein [Luteolibacter flavescens]MCW1885554.1 hypothetical protein [Luteolibacter flavescens]